MEQIRILDADIKQIKNILSQSRSPDKRRRGQEERRGKQLRELRVAGNMLHVSSSGMTDDDGIFAKYSDYSLAF